MYEQKETPILENNNAILLRIFPIHKAYSIQDNISNVVTKDFKNTTLQI